MELCRIFSTLPTILCFAFSGRFYGQNCVKYVHFFVCGVCMFSCCCCCYSFLFLNIFENAVIALEKCASIWKQNALAQYRELFPNQAHPTKCVCAFVRVYISKWNTVLPLPRLHMPCVCVYECMQFTVVVASVFHFDFYLVVMQSMCNASAEQASSHRYTLGETEKNETTQAKPLRWRNSIT